MPPGARASRGDTALVTARYSVACLPAPEGEGVVELDGKVYDLPSAVTPENCCWLRPLSVPAAEIKPENKLAFRVPDRAHAGFLLCTSSLVIETE
jgi:hypothetical protein